METRLPDPVERAQKSIAEAAAAFVAADNALTTANVKRDQLLKQAAVDDIAEKQRARDEALSDLQAAISAGK